MEEAVALVLSSIWLLATIWLLSRAFRQRNVFSSIAVLSSAGENPDRIAVIVPARDESANIGPCIEALQAQTYPGEDMRVVVVDDQSADDTAAIVEKIAAQDPRIQLVGSPILPSGWCGKPHACSVGANSVYSEPEWLCFTDADVRAGPHLLASAFQAAQAESLDFLSLAPRQELGSFAERLVMPCGFYILSFQQDLRKIDSFEGGDARATGQFILIRRAVYEAVGGHSAVRADVCEDLQLARLVKRSGYRVAFRGGRELFSTRMYSGWRTMWPGVSKNLVDMLDGPLRTAVAAVAGIVLAWAAVLVPLFDLWSCRGGWDGFCLSALALAMLASAAAFAFHVFGARFFGIPAAYGLLFPFGYTIGALIALDSLRLHIKGEVAWKGRQYPVGKTRIESELHTSVGE